MNGVFLDRDGVINELIYYEEAGIIDSPFTVEQFKLLPKAGQAIKLMKRSGFKVAVVSNQPGVAKCHFTEETLLRMTEKMERELANQDAFLDAVYYCLHHPQATNEFYKEYCGCRKPNPGLIIKAARDLDIDPSQSFMVGDSLTDIKAGQAVGCRTILLGKLKCEFCDLMDKEGVRPDFIAADILEAANLVLNGGDCLSNTAIGKSATT